MQSNIRTTEFITYEDVIRDLAACEAKIQPRTPSRHLRDVTQALRDVVYVCNPSHLPSLRACAELGLRSGRLVRGHEPWPVGYSGPRLEWLVDYLTEVTPWSCKWTWDAELHPVYAPVKEVGMFGTHVRVCVNGAGEVTGIRAGGPGTPYPLTSWGINEPSTPPERETVSPRNAEVRAYAQARDAYWCAQAAGWACAAEQAKQHMRQLCPGAQIENNPHLDLIGDHRG